MTIYDFLMLSELIRLHRDNVWVNLIGRKGTRRGIKNMSISNMLCMQIIKGSQVVVNES